MKGLKWYQAFAEFFFGTQYRYFVNHGTKEIHDIKRTEKRCRLNMIINGSWETRKGAKKLLKKGYNGCRYCNPELDEG